MKTTYSLLAVILISAACHAETDYSTFMKMNKRDTSTCREELDKSISSSFGVSTRTKNIAKATSSYMFRVYSKCPKTSFFFKDVKRFDGGMPNVTFDTFKERELTDMLRLKPNTKSSKYYEGEFDWTNAPTAFIYIEYKKNRTNQYDSYLLKHVMSSDVYLKHYITYVKTLLKTRSKKDFTEEEIAAYKKLSNAYIELVNTTFKDEKVRQFFNSKIPPTVVTKLNKEDFDKFINGFEELKPLFAEYVKSYQNAFQDSMLESSSYASSYKSRMSTAEFLKKLDWICNRGWSAEKKRNAIGDLIDK